MQYNLCAQKRDEQGTRASRRLRRAGQVPGIVYGGEAPAQPIALNHNTLYHLLEQEAFHSSLITLDIDGTKELVLLRDVQYHPFKPQVLHVDFQRVQADHLIHLKVPLHFVGEEIAPAVKLHGCVISHVMNEIDVQCLPANIPEFIEVDLSTLDVGHSLHVSHIRFPEGVRPVLHGHDDPVVATALKVRGSEESAAETESA